MSCIYCYTDQRVCCFFFLQLLERRRKEATEDEYQKFGPVLKIDYMSEDADASDGDGWCHLKLNWRADEVTKLFDTLDDRARGKRKEYMSEPTGRTKVGSSTKQPPKDAPQWAIKPTVTPSLRMPEATQRHSQARSGATPGRGTGRRGARTRGARNSSQTRTFSGRRNVANQSTSRETARKGINYSTQEVVSAILD